jgi:endonuclease YncB( thermonuclease family)
MLAAALFLCTVVSIHDGDTLRCSDGTRVRLHAIDTPEMPGACREGRSCAPGDPYRAKAALVKLAGRQTLRCDRTGTSYDRVTAYCSSRGVDLSCAMWRGGWAVRLEKFDRDRRLCR